MSEHLVIRLSSTANSADWVRVDSNGTRLSGVSNGSLHDAAREAGGCSVIVLIPATDVLTTSIRIPVRSKAKIVAALPFALEESLADDVETLHFAAGVRNDNGEVPVAVVAHQKMQEWIAQLAEAGIEPQRMVPENYGLATIPGTMSLLVAEDCTMFNDGAKMAFVMQHVKPSDLLVAAGKLDSNDPGDDNETEGGEHLVAFCLPEREESLSHDFVALRHELQSVDVNVLPDGVLPKLAVTIAIGHGVNLLQGAYGKKTEYSAQLGPWKRVAVLLMGLTVIALGTKGVDYYRLTEEKAALQAQFTAEYQKLRPGGDREVRDPLETVKSLRRQLGAVAAPAVFLPSLRELGTAMAANGAAQMQALEYRAGVVTIRLTAPDVPTLDKIQQAVSASGRFNASIQSTDQVADRINGRIQIREAGS